VEEQVPIFIVFIDKIGTQFDGGKRKNARMKKLGAVIIDTVT